MSTTFNRKDDEENALGAKGFHGPADSDSITSEPAGFNNGIDNGIGEVNRALKHRHLQMIGIGGGKSQSTQIPTPNISLTHSFSNWNRIMAWNWLRTHHRRTSWTSHRISSPRSCYDRSNGIPR